MDRDEMLRIFPERGGDPDRPGKKDPLDCVVWRGERPGEPSWESSLGRGRPGWHIECTAMAMEFLGASFDVQAGGTDLVFPHHEMSAGHSQVAEPDAPFAKAYAHAGMVAYDGEKMSKSRATSCSSRRCATATSTRWRSASCCCATTTAPTGSGPTPSPVGGRRHRRSLAPALALGAGAPRGPGGGGDPRGPGRRPRRPAGARGRGPMGRRHARHRRTGRHQRPGRRDHDDRGPGLRRSASPSDGLSSGCETGRPVTSGCRKPADLSLLAAEIKPTCHFWSLGGGGMTGEASTAGSDGWAW